MMQLKESKELEYFGGDSTGEALKYCREAGYRPLFMHEVVDARTEETDKRAGIWDSFFHTPSVRVVGRTKQGAPVILYAHTNNYLSEFGSENIEKFPQLEFQKLVDQDGMKDQYGNRLVWVVDHDKIKKFVENDQDSLRKSMRLSLENALEHPQTIPFCGGEERARKYLQRVKEVYDTSHIYTGGIDDLADEPIGHLLFIGEHEDCGLGNDVMHHAYFRILGAKPN